MVDYIFSGQVIRLTQKDYDRWKKAYNAIPDFDAKLTSLDDFYAELPPEEQKRWFVRCSQALQKDHQKHLKEQREELKAKVESGRVCSTEYVTVSDEAWEAYAKAHPQQAALNRDRTLPRWLAAKYERGEPRLRLVK